MPDLNDTARRSYNLTKTLVLSALLGAFAVLISLIYFFPFQTGIVLGILGFLGYLLVASAPRVKKTNSHTITIKKG